MSVSANCREIKKNEITGLERNAERRDILYKVVNGGLSEVTFE